MAQRPTRAATPLANSDGRTPPLLPATPARWVCCPELWWVVVPRTMALTMRMAAFSVAVDVHSGSDARKSSHWVLQRPLGRFRNTSVKISQTRGAAGIAGTDGSASVRNTGRGGCNDLGGWLCNWRCVSPSSQ
jgi:hypothetical protein